MLTLICMGSTWKHFFFNTKSSHCRKEALLFFYVPDNLENRVICPLFPAIVQINKEALLMVPLPTAAAVEPPLSITRSPCCVQRGRYAM